MPVAAIIKAIPTVTSTTPATRCGTGSVTLTATLSDEGSINWFTAASGGSAVGTNSFTTPSLTATTTFFAEAVAGGCSSVSRTPVVATIKPIPTIASSDVSRCDAGTVTFEAGSIGVISWYAALTGGSALGTGSNFTTPSLTVTTPYFIGATLDGCSTPTRTQVQAIVVATPAQPTITQNNSNVETPILTSSASTGNQWYKDDSQISGATNTSYTIADAGAYKVQVNNSGCLSPFSSVVNYVITGFEMADHEMLKLYPNPTADELVVSLYGFDQDKLINVSVFDLMGKALIQSTAFGGDEIRLKVGSYHPGTYLVLARQANRKIVRSFIKTR